MENKESDWVRRNIVEEPRLSELKEYYEELGFEVMLKDYSSGNIPGEICNSCMGDYPGRYKVIYTRLRYD